MRRRTFLITTAGTVAASGAGLYLVFRRGHVDAPLGIAICDEGKSLTVHLDDLLDSPGSVRKVGRAVLNAERIWPSQSELAERLFAGNAWSRACREGARATLREAIRNDFRENRTFQVRGWVLSRTEADLCALTELVLSSA